MKNENNGIVPIDEALEVVTDSVENIKDLIFTI